MVFTPIQNRLKSDFKIVLWGLATRSWAQNVCTLITSLQIEFVKSCWIHFNWNSLSFNSWIISRCFIFSLSNLFWFSKWIIDYDKPLSVNFWDRYRAQFLVKTGNIARDVTVGTKKIKLYVQVECQLCYFMKPILNGICEYEKKYAILNKNICHFLGPSPSAFWEKNPKHWIIYNWCNDALWIFSQKTRSVTVPRFGFFFTRTHG